MKLLQRGSLVSRFEVVLLRVKGWQGGDIVHKPASYVSNFLTVNLQMSLLLGFF
jgi:hypothetical protein